MDALVIIGLVFLLIFIYRNIGWWPYFWLSFGAFLGIFELLSHYFTGHTISQQFWLYQAVHPTSGYIAAGSFILFAILVALHLTWPRLSKKD